MGRSFGTDLHTCSIAWVVLRAIVCICMAIHDSRKMDWVSRWGTATLYPTTVSIGQSLLCKLNY